MRARADDIEIAYNSFGSGEPLILIGGLGAVKELWTEEFIGPLAEKFQVVAFDNRGMGQTPAGSKEFSISQFARDTAQFARRLGLERTHLLGYSMGGYVAQELALQEPGIVDKLVLMSTECGGAHGVRQEPGILLQLAADGAGDGADRHFFISAASIASGEVDLADLFEASDGGSSQAVSMQADAIKQWSGTCARLPGIDRPTLVITGTEDIVMLPENARVISELISGAKLVEMEGGDHGFILQFPARLGALIAEFLSSPQAEVAM